MLLQVPSLSLRAPSIRIIVRSCLATCKKTYLEALRVGTDEFFYLVSILEDDESRHLQARGKI